MKKFGYTHFLLGFMAINVWAAGSGELRTWTTVTGKTMEASFVSAEEDFVVLESSEGKKAKVSLEALSMADRLQLQDWGEITASDSLRRWTSQSGKSVVGTIKELEGDVIVFDLGAREVRMPKSNLSEGDQEFITTYQVAHEAKLQQEKQTRLEAMLNTPYGRFIPGGMTTFSLPVREEVRTFLDKEKVDLFEEIKMGIALPDNFDPMQKYPIIIAQITGSTKNGTCYTAMNKYKSVGMEEGCIVMGVSAPKKLSSEPYTYRNAMAEEGLAVLYASMPQAREWPIYFAGFSGGAKYSGGVAGMMAKNDYPIAGVFMAGCNEDTMSRGYDDYNPPKAYKKTPVFLSNGDKDAIAGYEKYGSYLEKSMNSSGFKNVRSESFDGKHEVSQEHFREALRWFKTFQ